MQIKTTMRYHFTHTRMATAKKKKKKFKREIVSTGKNVEKLESSMHCHRYVKWLDAVESTLVVPQKVKQNYHMTQLLCIYPKELKTGIQTNLVHK